MRSRCAAKRGARPLNRDVMRDQLPQRGAPLFFALTWLTVGFFAPVWVYVMNRDIQQVDASHTPNLNRMALFAFPYPIFLAAHAYVVNEGLPLFVIYSVRAAVLSSWVALVCLLFGGILAVAQYVRKKGVQLPGNVALLLLTFVLALSLPLLQRRLNAVASRNGTSRIAPSVVPNA
jgi:hypothetical protein